MPRTARMVIADEPAVYHVMSRTALDGFPLGSVEKDYLLEVIKTLSNLYFTRIYGFSIMGNHFHLLLKMLPDTGYTDEDIEKRLKQYYGPDYKMSDGCLPHLRLKLSNLSEFMRDVKVIFARYYNRRHNRRGYFWGDRFKSVIVDQGETLEPADCDTAHVILPIPELLDRRNSLRATTSALRCFFTYQLMTNRAFGCRF